MTEVRCDLACCVTNWDPPERLLAAVQIMCPHNHGDVLATVFRVEENTTAGPSVVTYIGTDKERATTLEQYSVTAHVKTSSGFRFATQEEIESGSAHGLQKVGMEPHFKWVATCPRETCNYALPFTRDFGGEYRKTFDRIEKLLDYYSQVIPGATVRAAHLDVDEDKKVYAYPLSCLMV